MKAAAFVCTYGRVEVCELLTMLERQTLQLPTLVYVDDAPHLRTVKLPDCVSVVHGGPIANFGAVRAAAVVVARDLFGLDEDSGLIVLDDDDFYSSRHFELTTRALEHAPLGWTGALAMGLTVDGGPVEFVRNSGGVGQHATWAFRLGLYDRAGGYDVRLRRDEDLALGYAMGFSNCAPHLNATHVRRQSRWGIAGAANFDRQLLRTAAHYTPFLETSDSAELAELEQWCATRSTTYR